MKRIWLIVLMLSAGSLCAKEKSTVIAISAFSHQLLVREDWNHGVVAVRKHVVSELVSQYNCITLARSHGCSIVVEEDIKKIANIQNVLQDMNAIVAADYSVSGHFQLSSDHKIECVMLCVDLSDRSKPIKRMTFLVPSFENASETITKELAKELKLERHSDDPSLRNEVGPKGLTWIVLPFEDFSNRSRIDETASNADDGLSVLAEIALQEEAGITNLVDHAAINKMLIEKNINSLNGTTELMAGQVGKMLGADKIVMGAVTKSPDSTLRLDLMIVDAETAVITDAYHKICEDRDELDDIVADIVPKLALRAGVTRFAVDDANGQRRREAEFYLDLARAARSSLTVAGCMAGVAHAEMAYLLEHDDPVFVYSVGTVLCNKVLGNHLPLSVQRYIIAVSDKILGKVQHSNQTPSPLLDQADAHNDVDEFAAGLEFALRHKQNHTGVEVKKCNSIIADSYIGLKNPKLALSYIKRIPNSERDHAVHVAESLIYKLLGNRKAEFDALDSLSPRSYSAYSKKLPRYIELMKECKGPKATIAFIESKQRRNSWLSSRTAVQYYLALSYADIGENEKAARICEWLLDEQRNPKEREKIQAILAKTGATKTKWCVARDIRPFPEEYAMYIQPLGDVDTNMLEIARVSASAFYGTVVKILPPLPLPKDTESYDEGRCQYRADILLKQTLGQTVLPDDAVAVAVLMRENMYFRRNRYNWGYVGKDVGSIMSYFIWQSRGRATIAQCVAKCVIGNYAHSLGVDVGIHPCITSYSGDPGTFIKKRHAFSPDAQDSYKRVDFKASHKKMQDRYKRAGAKILKRSDMKFMTVNLSEHFWIPLHNEQPLMSEVLFVDSGEQGLTGEYFSGMNFETQVLTRVDENIDFEWAKAPAEGLSEDNFSVRWTGKLKPVISGHYRFGAKSDDGVRVWLAGEKLIDNWTDHGETFDGSKVVQLEAGKEYGIKLEYYENSGGATIKLYWRREEK